MTNDYKSWSDLQKKIKDIPNCQNIVQLLGFSQSDDMNVLSELCFNIYIDKNVMNSIMEKGHPTMIGYLFNNKATEPYLNEFLEKISKKAHCVMYYSNILKEIRYSQQSKNTIYNVHLKILEILSKEYSNLIKVYQDHEYHGYDNYLSSLINSLVNHPQLSQKGYNVIMSLMSFFHKSKFSRYSSSAISSLLGSKYIKSENIEQLYFYFKEIEKENRHIVQVDFANNRKTPISVFKDLIKNPEVHKEIIRNPEAPLEILWYIQKESKLDISKHPNYNGSAKIILENIAKFSD